MTTDRDGDRAATNRGRSATLHVDVGPQLKADVREAARRAGMRPSDWVRGCLAKALLEQVDEAAGDEAVSPVDRPLRDTSMGSTRDLFDLQRPSQLSLQADDVEQLDQVVAAGGFRSRPAAVRYALRVMSTPESLAGLRQLPRTMAALVDSNVALQSAARLAAVFDAIPSEGRRATSGMDTAVLRQLPGHLEKTARVLAALAPLLAGAGGVPAVTSGQRRRRDKA